MTGDPTGSARALASRRNGARSRGPRTAAGKARSARNALKHGLCARTLLLDDENAAAWSLWTPRPAPSWRPRAPSRPSW